MLSLIEGDIESITWKKFGGYFENDGNGKSVKQNAQSYDIFTTEGVFGFTVIIETDNSFSPDELGIRAIALHTEIKNTDPSIPNDYVYGEFLCDISATEGVEEMHN